MISGEANNVTGLTALSGRVLSPLLVIATGVKLGYVVLQNTTDNI